MEKRKLGRGILKRGFKINNSVYTVSIPSETLVLFFYDSQTKTQEIYFDGFPVSIFRRVHQGKYGRWIANVYDRLMSVHYDHPAPYPISYFGKS